jgi:PilZ domain
MQTGRTEHRTATNTVASLEAAEEPAFNETVVFVNISEHGARFISRHRWPAGKRLILSDSLVNFRATAEVVYCAPQSSRRFAVGIKFYGTTWKS